MILSNMIKSERAYQEHKKDSLLKEYREAIEKGEDVLANAYLCFVILLSYNGKSLTNSSSKFVLSTFIKHSTSSF